MRGGGGIAGEHTGTGQSAHRLEGCHHQERGDTAGLPDCSPAAISTARSAVWPRRQRTRVGQRGAACQLVLRRQQRRLTRLHSGQHAAFGAERAHLAQSGQRIECRDP